MTETRTYELNDRWFIAKDPDNDGISRGLCTSIPKDAVPCHVPSIIQQFFPGYHGVAFYFCRFTPEITKNASDRLILRFGGVDYKAEVWLNGYRLGEYEGGETPFTFDVTDEVKIESENLLTVRVVNPIDKPIDGLNIMNIPHRNKVLTRTAGSNLNHGGIWYGVTLLSMPAIYVKDKFLTGNIHTGELKAELDICSEIPSDTEVTVKMNVSERTHSKGSVIFNSAAANVCNNSKLSLCLTVPDVHLWSPDDPYLYRVEIELESAYGVYRESLNFGFRELKVGEDGYFYLNGKKFLLKCSHSGNAFPVGQMFPVHPEHTRQDFIYAKACGFNTLRAIAGMFRPEQLDLADEIGLMVYEECLASWCMGYTQLVRFDSDEEYDRIAEEKGYLPLGDKEAMLKRFDHATANMIKRDRNHPCVVMWGLLNETYVSNIFKRAVAFLPKARELDPSRLILLASGRWDEDYSIGSLSNPYSNEWENLWGEDGNPNKDMYAGIRDGKEFTIEKKRAMGDCHYYATCPVSTIDSDLFRNMGHSSKPVFLSENGIGPLFHVIEEWKEFMTHGERPDLEDGSWVEHQSRALMKDWEALGLTAIYPFPEMMLKESQRQSADARRTMFDIVRSNPRFCGYSLTGLLDHGMCGEGLWSYWRRMKPEVFDAVSEGWAKLRFCLFMQRHIYRNESFTFEAVLANDGVLKSGEYTARFAVMSETGPVTVFSEKFTLDGNELAVPVIKKDLSLDLPTGKYYIIASMDEAAPQACKLDFYIMDKAELPTSNATVYTYKIEAAAEDFLTAHGVTVKPFSESCSGLILVGEADSYIVDQASRLAESGSTVMFMRGSFFAKDPALLSKLEIGKHLEAKSQHDWLYHKEAIILENTIHDGLGHGIVDFPRYGQIFPHFVYIAEEYPDEVICPTFQTGYFGVKDAYGVGYASCAYKKGCGKIVFNTFAVEFNIGHPAADRLLMNYILYLTR